ncbi:lipocalin family protein [Rhodococcus fascians]|uniref:lipocalin family protein n=1 Tax=Rhodococcoides fascians TaxID=1828 RepID=UPI00195BC72E|nr:lipocalin family protein [Rhodococcus fascians]MBM7242022.1 lipocalin family protein [Rhodococcus fascians]MBY3808726.1 lipocalin family protein [Rhodococcus fascians]MBY3840170.1 lipocalin family protein [Rhodococcus fascians]MBY3845065.1 lipocalin family protein [Rhodococcus fascians]MBY3848629.1 lipocalin family protein [Rhodococcus fascians]
MKVRTMLSRTAIAGAVAAGTLLGAAPAQAQPVGPFGSVGLEPLAPIPSLDVERYLGTWNQVAAVPQPFNLICARDTQANYQIIDESNIRVENTCTTWTGGENRIVGNARVNDTVTKAQLHVSFPGVPTQESQEGPTIYIVAYIADDYSWAFVGSPSRTSGFVLKRTPDVSVEQFREIRSVVESLGYDSNFITTTPTPGGATTIQQLSTV